MPIRGVLLIFLIGCIFALVFRREISRYANRFFMSDHADTNDKEEQKENNKNE